MRRCRSCTSLKLASTHNEFSRDHGHQRLSGLYVLAQLHAALRDIAGDGRHHGVALRGDPRVAIHVLRLQHGRVVRHVGAVDQGVRGLRLAYRLRQCGPRQFHGLVRVPHLLRRDRAVGDQGLAFREVGFGSRQLQTPGFDGRIVLVRRRTSADAPAAPFAPARSPRGSGWSAHRWDRAAPTPGRP